MVAGAAAVDGVRAPVADEEAEAADDVFAPPEHATALTHQAAVPSSTERRAKAPGGC
ncbi:hypothetical protein [Streptomyces violascens]|uniref:hypothetical protein n=1 Tax=Streptomyces violascens TaxID=67381 RepID=UPI0036B116FB